MEPSTEKPPRIPMDARALSGDATDYMANRAMAQRCQWDEETGGYRYKVDSPNGWHGRRDLEPEKVEEIAERLPLVVPGLKVVKKMFRKMSGYMNYDHGYVWFTWSMGALWERVAEVYEEHGVADERIAYMKCSGVEDVLKEEPVNPEPQQLRLPGVVEVTPLTTNNTYATGSIGKFRNIQSGWTGWGLKTIESGFIQRIRDPNQGGPGAYPYRNHVLVGNEWWFVGSRGDAAEILELEIQGSPLMDRTKMNLLENLANFPRDAGARKPHTALD